MAADWFYERDGAQQGAVTEDEMARLVQTGAVNPTTRVWTSAFGSQWRPVRDTQFSPNIPQQQPPALATPISNKWMWLLVVTPVAASILGNMISAYTGQYNTLGHLIWLSWLPNVIFSLADFSYVKRQGYEERVGKIGFWGVLLVPVYMFIRNKRLSVSQLTFWLFILSIVIASVIDAAVQPDT